MLTLAVLAAPWLVIGLFALLRVRLPRELPTTLDSGTDPPPRVSVIIPARNEEINIATCVSDLVAQDYPDFEVIVVDDRSHDRTAEIARTMERGRAHRLHVVRGEPLPEGWFGKPWACHQGASIARGDMLLFTDADTRHAPGLLGRAVAGLLEDGTSALTLVGRQLLGSFWEYVAQPHFFAGLVLRYPGMRDPITRKKDALANGQYILFTREEYERIGGHESVMGEVVEDLRLAQVLVEKGGTLSVRAAEDMFATRMYRSLGGLIGGWSKNIGTAAGQMFPPWFAPVALPCLVAGSFLIWLVPPGVLILFAAGRVPVGVGAWASGASALSALFWMAVTWRLRAPFFYGIFYPLGASVAGYVLLRSWLRGSHIEWKGRVYRGGIPVEPDEPSSGTPA